MKTKHKLKISYEVTLTLTEIEARVLSGMASYGADRFLRQFKDIMGKTYLKPEYKKGIDSLFDCIYDQISPQIALLDKTRIRFNQHDF